MGTPALVRLGWAAACGAALAAVIPATAHAGELQVDVGARLSATTWRGDFGGGGKLQLGYRFARIVAVDLGVSEELMGVDTRLTTGLTLGVTGVIPRDGVRPWIRAFFIHQHEEALVSVAEAPLGVLFGIGDGIRHRAGGGGTLGLEIPVVARGALELVVLPAATIIAFSEDDLGPGASFSLGGGVGINYGVPGLP